MNSASSELRVPSSALPPPVIVLNSAIQLSEDQAAMLKPPALVVRIAPASV